MSTVAEATRTPVTLGGNRGGPAVRHLRTDRWWVQPLVSGGVLAIASIYSVWAAIINKDFYAGAAGRHLLSPLYSPCVTAHCTGDAKFVFTFHWWTISPALLVLVLPLGFRATCYYYRKAYYRSFWSSPPACGVADAHSSYSGESRFPLVLQNIHRYFFYILLVYNVLLTIDAFEAFRMGSRWGLSIGTLVLVVNAVLLWTYSLSCHACRHAVGGKLNLFSRHPFRYQSWKFVTKLNAKHMQIAWASLIWVTLSDLYVRLVASGTIRDPRFF